MKEFSSYRIGGPARYFFEAKSVAELKGAIREANKNNLKIFVLGGGTNLLIGDGGFDGLVLKPSLNFINSSEEETEVGAGILVADFLNFCVEKKLSGMEWAGGLPGTVGGAVRGNAGAFGGEMKDSVRVVRSLNVHMLEQVERSNSDCLFSYRSSVFKKEGGEIIVSAVFKLKKGNGADVKKAVQEKIDYRKERHPLEYPNIGSIFKNVPLVQIYAEHTQNYAEALCKSAFSLRGPAVPVKVDPFPVVPAAFLISEAGLKGMGCGGAMISEKHPNFIINFSEANSKDVDCLINLAKREVKKRFGVELEEEIVRI